ncbi:MAG: type VI secretion system protein TssA [Pseudomonadota bacterium]
MNHLVQGAGLEALLAPLAPLPCGPDIYGGAAYSAIREARRADDMSLPEGDWDKPVYKRSDWALAERLCVDALRKESKDLNIAAWLCEAWIHLRGLAGLADGLRMIEALADQYWDQVNPLMEDGDISFRTGPFNWLARNLPLALQSVQLAPGATPAGRALTLAEWQAVLRAERQGAQAAAAQRRFTAPAPPPEQTLRAHFMTAAAHAPAGFYDTLRRQVGQATWALEQLEAMLEARMRADAPSLAQVTAILKACADALQELDEPRVEPETEEVEEMNQDAKLAPLRREAIESRVEAYRRLSEVADYLMRTEPHSPVPHLVRRAVQWGDMPFEELLQELLDSESDLKQIYRLLGLRSA